MIVDKKKISNFLVKEKLLDPWDIIDLFEKKISKFSGSKYAVAVDCCTNAIFLCLKFYNKKKILTIPENTYISVLTALSLANYKFKIKKIDWVGSYQIKPTPIIDSATRFTKNMYLKKTLTCLSFHHRKHIPIGRGGMILTDSLKAYKWLKKARYDGRDLSVNYAKDDFKSAGWHMYMTPEQAYYGLKLLKNFKNTDANRASSKTYKSIKKYHKFYKTR